MVCLSTPLREPHGTLARAIEQARDANALGYFLEYLREKAEAHDQHSRADFAFSGGFLLPTPALVRPRSTVNQTRLDEGSGGVVVARNPPTTLPVPAEVEP
jgi:hypothetical protein